MKQVTGLLATYSSDEFGICSALYELGGMVVMHDASGCNSTYTTHDEPRWYEQESMIYISALSEMEAIMGDDDKLIRDITETARELVPAFIAIVGAPIPYMIGTDFPAVAAVVEKNTGIPCFGFPANGMNGYLAGVSMALEAIVRRFCTDGENSGNSGQSMLPGQIGQTGPARRTRQPGQIGQTDQARQTRQPGQIGQTGQAGNSVDQGLYGCLEDAASVQAGASGIRVNILGATPLDFSLNGSVDSMKNWLRENGFTPLACLAMGSTLEEISHAGEAQVNLVVSYGGLAAAKFLRSRFGTPYVTGVPLSDAYAKKLAGLIERAAKTGKCLHGIFSEAGDEQAADYKVLGKAGDTRFAKTKMPGELDDIRSAKAKKTDGSNKTSQYAGGDDAQTVRSDKTNEHGLTEEEGIENRRMIIGESIYSISLAEAIELETGLHMRVLCPLETEDALLREGDVVTPEEDDILTQAGRAKVVVADPLYRTIVPAAAKFYPLPHEAFSGRIYDEENPNLVNRKLCR